MFPEPFIRRIKTQKYIDSDLLLDSLSKPSPATIRLNLFKWNKIPAESSPVPWCSTGYYLAKRPSFTADPLYHAGCYYPQDASGMFLEVIFNQFFQEKGALLVLDLCGAPGSKSTHLSSLIGDNGCLITNEVIKSRTTVLAENITRWGITNTIVTNNDPHDFSKLRGYFDLIVVDAPCSGEGMFRDPLARLEWSEKNTTLCALRQRRILADVWPALKKDGILIYSTCTFNPAENEENIKWLTDNTHSECLRINIASFPEITEISFKGITGYGFFPGRIKGEGLFVSVLRKKEDSTEMKIKKHPKIKPLSANEFKTAAKITGKYNDNLLKINDTVYLLPVNLGEYLSLSSSLHILKPGTKIFRNARNEIIPEHDAAVSTLLKKDAFPDIELNYEQAINYLRRETMTLRAPDRGWYIASYKGCNLGFLKSTGTRINNYFPIQLRIRMSAETLSEKQIIQWCE